MQSIFESATEDTEQQPQEEEGQSFTREEVIRYLNTHLHEDKTARMGQMAAISLCF